MKIGPRGLDPRSITGVGGKGGANVLGFSVRSAPNGEALLSGRGISCGARGKGLRFRKGTAALGCVATRGAPRGGSGLGTGRVSFGRRNGHVGVSNVGTEGLTVTTVAMICPVTKVTVLLVPGQRRVGGSLSFAGSRVGTLGTSGIMMGAGSGKREALRRHSGSAGRVMSVGTGSVRVPRGLKKVRLAPVRRRGLGGKGRVAVMGRRLGGTTGMGLSLGTGGKLSVGSTGAVRVGTPRGGRRAVKGRECVSSGRELRFMTRGKTGKVSRVFGSGPARVTTFLRGRGLSGSCTSCGRMRGACSDSERTAGRAIKRRVSARVSGVSDSVGTATGRRTSVLKCNEACKGGGSAPAVGLWCCTGV